METELLNIEKVSPEEKAAALKKAGEIIREGGLVAFPTETVYGLGADALNAEASAKIYAAKGRPSDNPLIVHIHDVDQVYEIASEVPEAAKKVMEKFWPGPLMYLPQKPSRMIQDLMYRALKSNTMITVIMHLQQLQTMVLNRPTK